MPSQFVRWNPGRVPASQLIGHLPLTIGRVWDKARKAALTENEYRSPLVRRPYDLRHACVSTWLAAGVPSTQCAELAGHSVAVLHQIYGKVVAGLESAAHQRIEQALDWRGEDADRGGE